MMPGSNDCLPWTPQDLKRNISDRFEKVVERYSDSVALSGSSGSLTYQELNQRANSLARSILHKLGGEEEPIALIFQHDIDLIVAQMATLKAGKAYVCLDLDLPESRLRSIVTQLEPRICLTNDQCYPLALSIIREKSLLLNCDQIDLNSSNDNLSYSWKSERLAAIFFTSGSTGKPKGVKRDHKGILHRSQVDIDAHCVSPQDRCSLLTSCSHGSSSSDVFCALLSGATLSLLPIRSEGIISLADWIDREAITILHMPVEFLRQWMDLAPDREKLHSVRLLRPAGKLYRSDIEAIRKVFPKHCLIRSQLSSAETNLLTYMIIDYDKEIKTPIVPVGYAVEGKQILLLDDNGNQANPGEAGEIVVKSLYLSSGYWKNEQLEQQKFIPGNDHDPRTLFFTGDLGRWNTDGMLELIGRKDSMIKVRGYRVEISEVEAALLAIDAVKQVTVIGGVSAPESGLIAYSSQE